MNVFSVFFEPHQAGVEEAERGGHQQHERGRHQHPRRVAGVHLGRLGQDRAHHEPCTGVTAPSIGLARADADHLLERNDEDLAVADLPGLRALAEGVDGGLDERLRDRDLEADLLGQPHLHGRAAVGLDPVQLAAVALHTAEG